MKTRSRRIKSVTLIPPLAITAIYCERDGSIFRNPIIFAAVIDNGEVDDDFELWDLNHDGVFFDSRNEDNILGFEFNGIEQDWSEQIKYYLNNIE